MDKRVAIIIVTYNSRQFLPDLFLSLEKINYQKDKFRIVIVDNASSDGSVEIIKEFTAHSLPLISIYNKTNAGFAGGNNIGLKYAIDNGFDYAYLLNPDTVIDKNFLIEIVKFAQSHQDAAAVQSRLMLYGKENIIQSAGNQIHYLGFGYSLGYKQNAANYHPPTANNEITYPSGAAVLLRLDVLKEIGILKEELFSYHEDLELGWRLHLLGFKVFLAWDSVVYHKYEFSRSIKNHYYMERNRCILLFQNYKWKTLILLSPALFIMEIIALFRSFFTGFFWQRMNIYKYFLSLENWKKIVYNKKYIAQHRKIKDKDVIKRFSGKFEYQERESILIRGVLNPLFNIYFQIILYIIIW